MQRMAEPDAVERILRLLADRTSRLVRSSHSFAERLGNSIDRRVVDELH
jgi:hypothetical protein